MNNHNFTDSAREEILKDIDKGMMLDRLLKIEDFRILIMEGYIEERLLETTEDLLSTCNDTRNNALQEVTSASSLKRYLKNIADSAYDAKENGIQILEENNNG
jgi:hypothetical protein